jgi:hypothetical protein
MPPSATNSFLLASTSREFKCQCPIVTPASFGGAACAEAEPANTQLQRESPRSLTGWSCGAQPNHQLKNNSAAAMGCGRLPEFVAVAVSAV